MPDLCNESFVRQKAPAIGGIDHPMPRMRLSAAGQRTSMDGLPQIGGHYVLAFLQGCRLKVLVWMWVFPSFSSPTDVFFSLQNGADFAKLWVFHGVSTHEAALGFLDPRASMTQGWKGRGGKAEEPH